MNPERWKLVAALFQRALDADPADRPRILRDATAGDPELLREVESLLATHDQSGQFLEAPAWQVAAELILDDEGTLAGRQLGAYRVLEEIGRGGMGVVYSAEDQRLGRTVALKALPPEWAADPQRRERLTREARAAAALSHPAIATVFALDEVDGALYLVTEFVPGRTLRQELADGPLPPAVLLPTLCEIASALVAAHARGIVHRDLKPENILRRDDGQIKVLDFGLARLGRGPGAETGARLTETGLLLGTPAYMAPEQASGGEADERSDIFAVGVIAWELSTGGHPFRSDPGLTQASVQPRPAGLLPIANRCLQARPEERYQRVADLLSDLRSLEPGSARAHDGTAGWWWRFHQAAIAVLNAAAPIAAWAARGWIHRPYGSWLFYSVLVLATVSVTVRLNLLFTSRVHAGTLPNHHARLYPLVAAADALLAVALAAAAALLAGTSDELGALLLIFSVVMLVSLAFVEPATTRAAGLRRT